ncbi:MAG: DUF4079 domain-containing protein [Desulfovibrio sp.]|jgi:hypothetical protein|nr:DUF4079 domain-containing protein [Desulfovibrio sp.]
MLWVHPSIQLLATILAMYVLRLGWKRFCSAHLGIKCLFRWKDHVQWGQFTLGLWAGGLLLGLWAAHWEWSVYGLTGTHFWVGLAMGAVIPVSFLTGLRMDSIKKRRTIMPLVHAGAGFLLMALAAVELITGLVILSRFVAFSA